MAFLVGFFIMAACIMHPQNRVRTFTIFITRMAELQRELQSVADSTEGFSGAVVDSERIWLLPLRYPLNPYRLPRSSL